ncbi:LysR family transcriptional regulator [Haliangium sp.]|uniref:LysR family transcriptional regulator n=1 Tax=Haliangium sp. TaxID=2663208 RepID=UPI003D0AFC27
MITTNSLTELHLFVRIVEAGSLRAAALELGVEPSSVTRRLAALEARLGVTLFRRTRARTTPTDAGQRYYAGLRPLLDQLDALEADVQGTSHEPTGLLRVAAPTDFGARFVAPVLRRLQERYADLRIDLVLGSGFVDLVAQNIDVAIRVGHLPDSNLVATTLADVPRVLVAAPSYLARRGTPETPDQLGEHDFIGWKSTRDRLTVEFEDGSRVELRCRFAVGSVLAIQGLVAEGVGVHLGPRWAFQEGIDQGRFVALLDAFPVRAYPLRALYASATYMPAKIRHFVDDMRAAVACIPGIDARVVDRPSRARKRPRGRAR